MSPLDVLPGSGSALPVPRASDLRRYYIETWGCQMNELDSQRMAGQLMAQGLLPTREPRDADVILLNSCSVREKAENKVYSRLGEYRRFKDDNPSLLVGLCGCVAQQEGERALQRVPDLDFVLGPARVGELRSVLEERRAGRRVVATGFPDQRSYDFDAIDRDGLYKGMVTVIEGCNKRCTFCIVPSTRGPERCRPFDEILDEVRHLLDFGFLEIELLGQTVNHWRDPARHLDFSHLLDAVARLEGLERLRFVTSYPRDFTPAMVEQLGKHENICPYLHLPVQSGSDRVLRRMGRGYEVAAYRQLLADIRVAGPDINLSTDLIVGFPGESDEDFEETVELVREVRYGSIFAFKYSPRPGTPGADLPDHVPDAVMSERLAALQALVTRQQQDFAAALIGSEMDILLEKPGRVPGQITGRSPWLQPVILDEMAGEIGDIVKVRITKAGTNSLHGEWLKHAPA
ncbi:MAG: tRNA (N6-isopentenyl adenosine(37)-C2)-methylthiotransferase MiaB [Acidobacteria bacterium]|nr:tRNA (N6-isopentenyl adenosine(37)-C2)-methylthiotransferase MiaB [Acidobacteriota bacterium]